MMTFVTKYVVSAAMLASATAASTTQLTSLPRLVEHFNEEGGSIAFVTEANYKSIMTKLPMPRSKPDDWDTVVVDTENGVFDLVQVGNTEDLASAVYNGQYTAGHLSSPPEEKEDEAFHIFPGGEMNMRSMFMNALPEGELNSAFMLGRVVDKAIVEVLKTDTIGQIADSYNLSILDAHTCVKDDFVHPTIAEVDATTDLLKQVLDDEIIRIACHDSDWGVSGTFSAAEDGVAYSSGSSLGPQGIYPSVDRVVVDAIAEMYGIADLKISYVKVDDSAGLFEAVNSGSAHIGSSYMFLNGVHEGLPRKSSLQASCTYMATQSVFITPLKTKADEEVQELESEETGLIIGFSVTGGILLIAIIVASVFIYKLRRDRQQAYKQLREGKGVEMN